MTNITEFTFAVADQSPETVRRIARSIDNLLLNDLGYPVTLIITPLENALEVVPCANCGAVPGTPEYDNYHDSQNCWN